MTCQSADDSHISFAKRLAHNNKKIREQTLKKLQRWLVTKSKSGTLSQDELLKIFKGLYYSMWYSDKPLLQEALAAEIASILGTLPERSASLDYFTAFCETISREWTGIDRLRLDKFYMFFKTFVKRGIIFCESCEWDEVVVEGIAKALDDKIININCTCPDSIAVFLAENLYPICSEIEGGLPAGAMYQLLMPYVNLLAVTPKRDMTRLLMTHIFNPLCAEDSAITVDKAALSEYIFTLARGKSILTRNRKILYKLKVKLGGDVVIETDLGEKRKREDEENIPDNVKCEDVKMEVVEPVESVEKKKKKKKKSKKKKTEAEEDKAVSEIISEFVPELVSEAPAQTEVSDPVESEVLEPVMEVEAPVETEVPVIETPVEAETAEPDAPMETDYPEPDVSEPAKTDIVSESVEEAPVEPSGPAALEHTPAESVVPVPIVEESSVAEPDSVVVEQIGELQEEMDVPEVPVVEDVTEVETTVSEALVEPSVSAAAEPDVQEANVEEAIVEEAIVEEAAVEEAIDEEAVVNEQVEKVASVESLEDDVNGNSVEENMDVHGSFFEQDVGEGKTPVSESIVETPVEPSEPAATKPVVEAPVVEEPVVETPVVEGPVVEEPVVEGPVVEEPVVEEPVVEEPVVETPVVEEPVLEGPVVEAPIVEAPVVEEPVVEGPVLEELVVEEPVVEEPVVEELDEKMDISESPSAGSPVENGTAGPSIEVSVIEAPVVDTPETDVPSVETDTPLSPPTELIETILPATPKPKKVKTPKSKKKRSLPEPSTIDTNKFLEELFDDHVASEESLEAVAPVGTAESAIETSVVETPVVDTPETDVPSVETDTPLSPPAELIETILPATPKPKKVKTPKSKKKKKSFPEPSTIDTNTFIDELFDDHAITVVPEVFTPKIKKIKKVKSKTPKKTTSPILEITPQPLKKKVRLSIENNTYTVFKKNSSIESPTTYDSTKTPTRSAIRRSSRICASAKKPVYPDSTPAKKNKRRKSVLT